MSGLDLMEYLVTAPSIAPRKRPRVETPLTPDEILARQDSLAGELARMRLRTAERRRVKTARGRR